MRRPSLILVGLLAALVACSSDGSVAPNSHAISAGPSVVQLLGVVVMTEEEAPRLALQTSSDIVILVDGDALAASLGETMLVSGHWTADDAFAVEAFQKADKGTNGETLRVRGG